LTENKKEIRYTIPEDQMIDRDQLIAEIKKLDHRLTDELTASYMAEKMEKDMYYDRHSIEGTAQVKKALLYMQFFGVPPENLPHVLREIGLRRGRN